MRLTLSLTMLMMGLLVRTAVVGAMEPSDHRIGPGDTVEIQVEPQCQFDRVTTVSPDGQIRLPISGSFTAAGLTSDELAERLHGELTRELVEPRIAVCVRRPIWRTVCDASLGSPGEFSSGSDAPR